MKWRFSSRANDLMEARRPVSPWSQQHDPVVPHRCPSAADVSGCGVESYDIDHST